MIYENNLTNSPIKSVEITNYRVVLNGENGQALFFNSDELNEFIIYAESRFGQTLFSDKVAEAISNFNPTELLIENAKRLYDILEEKIIQNNEIAKQKGLHSLIVPLEGHYSMDAYLLELFAMQICKKHGINNCFLELGSNELNLLLNNTNLFFKFFKEDKHHELLVRNAAIEQMKLIAVDPLVMDYIEYKSSLSDRFSEINENILNANVSAIFPLGYIHASHLLADSNISDKYQILLIDIYCCGPAFTNTFYPKEEYINKLTEFDSKLKELIQELKHAREIGSDDKICQKIINSIEKNESSLCSISDRYIKSHNLLNLSMSNNEERVSVTTTFSQVLQIAKSVLVDDPSFTANLDQMLNFVTTVQTKLDQEFKSIELQEAWDEFNGNDNCELTNYDGVDFVNMLGLDIVNNNLGYPAAAT